MKLRAGVGTALVAAGILSSVLALSAQTAKPITDEDYVKAMKQVGPLFMALGKENAAMQHAQAAADAKTLSDLFKQVQTYWEAKKVDDAVAFAKTAVKAADDTVTNSTAMNMTALADAQKALGGACQGCHMAHRERLPDGTFKIK